jgi:hypothetical protein
MNWIILAGLTILGLATLMQDGGHFWRIGDSGRSVDVSFATDNGRLLIEAAGNIELAPDGSGVAELADGGYLDVTERRNGTDRRVRFEDDDGAIGRQFWTGGDEQPWDADANRFVAEIMPVVLRETGISARERVAWLLENRGDAGLVDEIDLIESDFAQQLFTVEYAESATIPDALLQRLATIAENHMGSDFSLRVTLTRLYETQRPTGANLAALLGAATTIGSDFEARQLLDVVNGALDTPEAVTAFFRVTDSIGSDFELRQALTPIVTRRDVADDVVEQAIATAGREIGSDFELRVVLSEVAARVGSSDTLSQAYVTAVDNIGSDFEHKEALLALANGAELSPAGWRLLLMSAAQGIGGDFECASLLAAVAPRLPKDDDVVAAYRAALDSIGSEFEGQRAAAALSL